MRMNFNRFDLFLMSMIIFFVGYLIVGHFDFGGQDGYIFGTLLEAAGSFVLLKLANKSGLYK